MVAFRRRWRLASQEVSAEIAPLAEPERFWAADRRLSDGGAGGRVWWDGVTRIHTGHKPPFSSPSTAALKVFPRCFILTGRTVGGARSGGLCREEHEPAGDSPQHQHRRHQHQSAEPLPVLSSILELS